VPRIRLFCHHRAVALVASIRIWRTGEATATPAPAADWRGCPRTRPHGLPPIPTRVVEKVAIAIRIGYRGRSTGGVTIAPAPGAGPGVVTTRESAGSGGGFPPGKTLADPFDGWPGFFVARPVTIWSSCCCLGSRAPSPGSPSPRAAGSAVSCLPAPASDAKRADLHRPAMGPGKPAPVRASSPTDHRGRAAWTSLHSCPGSASSRSSR
jgi:hypothetical protein